MKVPTARNDRGFTLIELLVVIAIIGVLASVVLAALNSARAKARDANRKAQISEVAKALEMYYNDHGTYVVSGGGYGGNGNGWLSYKGGSYPDAVTQILTNDGYLGGLVTDPSGATTIQNSHAGYMIAANSTKYTLWADLENPSAADTATQNTCALSNYDNYAGRINYCISN